MKTSSQRPVNRSTDRSGAIMIFILIALLVASIIVAATVRTTGMSYRQLKRDEIRLQASLLVDAGRRRTLVRLSEDESFTGERWKIVDGQLGLDRPAIITTTVELTESKPEERRITAVAEFPIGHPDQVRLTRTWIVTTNFHSTK